MAQKIKLGRSYRDTVTGFEGRATARYEYENGCVRFEITSPKLSESGKVVEQVFDEQRLETVSGRKPAQTARAGGPRTAPARPSTPSR